MSVGILLIAHDNEVIRYGRLAGLNARLCRRVLPNTPICLVTDDQTDVDVSQFDSVIYETSPSNSVRHYISDGESIPGIFRNRTRSNLYHVTPFKETLVLDTDYLVFNPHTLDHLSDSRYDVMLNTDVRSVYGVGNPILKKIDPATIPLRWATVVYWRQTPVGEQFFRVVKHVEDNYEWFAKLYRFSPKLYRNDFSFSIATHVMNGYSDFPLMVGSLPTSDLLFSWDFDQLVDWHDTGLVIAADIEGTKKIPVRTHNQNIHFMNKRDLDCNLDAMMSYYE